MILPRLITLSLSKLHTHCSDVQLQSFFNRCTSSARWILHHRRSREAWLSLNPNLNHLRNFHRHHHSWYLRSRALPWFNRSVNDPFQPPTLTVVTLHIATIQNQEEESGRSRRFEQKRRKNQTYLKLFRRCHHQDTPVGILNFIFFLVSCY